MGSMMEQERMQLVIVVKAHPQYLDDIEVRLRENLEHARDTIPDIDTLEVVRTK